MWAKNKLYICNIHTYCQGADECGGEAGMTEEYGHYLGSGIIDFNQVSTRGAANPYPDVFFRFPIRSEQLDPKFFFFPIFFNKVITKVLSGKMLVIIRY